MPVPARLLTPEELAHGRPLPLPAFNGAASRVPSAWWNCNAEPNSLTDDFLLLYGGIDSDGITERARDITAIMAGVAKRNAVQTSCPVVMREFHLVPEEERRLFGGIDRSTIPGLHFGAQFEIEAASQVEKETLSLEGSLAAGFHTVRLSFLNDYSDGTSATDRNVHLDRLDVRDAAGEVVVSYELETVEPEGDGKSPNGDNFALWRERSLDVPIAVPTARTVQDRGRRLGRSGRR